MEEFVGKIPVSIVFGGRRLLRVYSNSTRSVSPSATEHLRIMHLCMRVSCGVDQLQMNFVSKIVRVSKARNTIRGKEFEVRGNREVGNDVCRYGKVVSRSEGEKRGNGQAVRRESKISSNKF